MATQAQLAPVRPRRTELHPLITAEKVPDRRVFVSPVYRSSPSIQTPDSAISLASPSLNAVRQYYRDNGLTTALQKTPTARNGNIPQHYPRRHSSISGPLAQRLNRVNVSSPLTENSTQSSLPPLHRARFRSIAEETRSLLLSGVERNDREKLASVVDRRSSSILADSTVPGPAKESFEHTQQRLRYWGRAYLGNVGTADVLVNACHLRKPEPVQTPSKDASPESSNSASTAKSPETSRTAMKASIAYDAIVVRARITPSNGSKDRMPFLIQRRFNVAELRASIASTRRESSLSSRPPSLSPPIDKPKPATTIPDSKDLAEPQNILSWTPNTPSSHARNRNVIGSTTSHAIAVPERRSSLNTSIITNRKTMPIHVEYALHYLPVLAALMLSGHIRKGDVIDLPLPHPEVWNHTVTWIYTGKGEVTSAVGENILYLGGRVEADWFV